MRRSWRRRKLWDEWWGLRYNSSQEPKYLHIVKQIIKKEGGGRRGRGGRGRWQEGEEGARYELGLHMEQPGGTRLGFCLLRSNRL